MPSEFASRFQECALPGLFEQHGEPITFDGNAITAIVGAVEAQPQLLEDGREMHYVRTITLQTSDVPSPKRGQVATIDGLDWAVHSVPGSEAGQVRVAVVRPVKLDGGGRRALSR